MVDNPLRFGKKRYIFNFDSFINTFKHTKVIRVIYKLIISTLSFVHIHFTIPKINEQISSPPIIIH